MCSGERPIGDAKGKQTKPTASCQPPPPPLPRFPPPPPPPPIFPRFPPFSSDLAHLFGMETIDSWKTSVQQSEALWLRGAAWSAVWLGVVLMALGGSWRIVWLCVAVYCCVLLCACQAINGGPPFVRAPAVKYYLLHAIPIALAGIALGSAAADQNPVAHGPMNWQLWAACPSGPRADCLGKTPCCTSTGYGIQKARTFSNTAQRKHDGTRTRMGPQDTDATFELTLVKGCLAPPSKGRVHVAPVGGVRLGTLIEYAQQHIVPLRASVSELCTPECPILRLLHLPKVTISACQGDGPPLYPAESPLHMFGKCDGVSTVEKSLSHPSNIEGTHNSVVDARCPPERLELRRA